MWWSFGGKWRLLLFFYWWMALLSAMLQRIVWNLMALANLPQRTLWQLSVVNSVWGHSLCLGTKTFHLALRKSVLSSVEVTDSIYNFLQSTFLLFLKPVKFLISTTMHIMNKKYVSCQKHLLSCKTFMWFIYWRFGFNLIFKVANIFCTCRFENRF